MDILRSTSSRVEEDVDARMYPCGTTMESRTHIVEVEIYKEERDALEEVRKLDESDMKVRGRLERSENTIAILGRRR